uniref:Uncharacterized protein n=1 Tax=Mustela putorius furo TaxID=9669 RepID=M3Y4N5_MUSPF
RRLYISIYRYIYIYIDLLFTTYLYIPFTHVLLEKTSHTTPCGSQKSWTVTSPHYQRRLLYAPRALPWRSVSKAVSASRCGHFLKGEVQQGEKINLQCTEVRLRVTQRCV